jgi:hypothetical protein
MQDSIWMLSAQDRLAAWKKFRDEIAQLDVSSAVLKTTQLWSFAPFVAHYLHAHDHAHWPDPWQLLAENYYCDLAKALGMLYTLQLSGHGTGPLELRIMYDHKNQEEVNVVVIDNHYVINLEFATVVNIQTISERYSRKYSFTLHDLKIQKY